MKDGKQPERPMYLHEVDLGMALTDADISRIVTENKDSDVVRAVLQLLRNRAAEDRVAATGAGRNGCFVEQDASTGAVRIVPANKPEFHLGAAQGCEDVFWTLFAPPMAVEEAATA